MQIPWKNCQSMGIQVLRTDKQGTVTAYSGGNGITWDVSPCNDYTPGNPDDTGTMAGDAGVAAYTYTQGETENSQSTDADTQDLGDGNSDQETEAEAAGLDLCNWKQVSQQTRLWEHESF